MKTFLILLLSGCCSLAGIQTGPAAGGSGSATNVSLSTDGSVNVTTNGAGNWTIQLPSNAQSVVVNGITNGNTADVGVAGNFIVGKGLTVQHELFAQPTNNPTQAAFRSWSPQTNFTGDLAQFSTPSFSKTSGVNSNAIYYGDAGGLTNFNATALGNSLQTGNFTNYGEWTFGGDRTYFGSPGNTVNLYFWDDAINSYQQMYLDSANTNLVWYGSFTLAPGGSFKFNGNGAGLTNITPSSLTGLVTLVNTTNWISFPAIGWTNNTTSTYYMAYLTAGSSLTFKDGNGNGIWAITISLPFVVGPGNKITGTGITGSLQQMPW